MVITHFDFQRMTLPEQGEAVWTKGTFFGERREKGIWIQCYSLGSFYVEVYYDNKDNRLVKFESFTQASYLAPYMLLAINQGNQ